MTRAPRQGTQLRRHPLTVLAGLLVAAAALWVGYFLATFDLDRYREQLTRQLTSRLHLPVRLGEAHLELREGGVAFRFTQVQIGTERTPVELRARKLWLQLAWHGLLLRKPILTGMALDTPLLRISPPAASLAEEAPPESSFDLKLLNDLRVRSVEINNGALDIKWIDQTGTSRSLSLGDLTIELADLGLARPTAFDLTGNLLGQATPARLTVKGSLELPASGSLTAAVWDLTLNAKALDVARLAKFIPGKTGVTAEGSADLALFLKGTPAQTATIQAELTGTKLQFHGGPAYREPLPLKHLQIAATWQHKDGNHLFREMALQFNDLRLAGEVAVAATGTGREITGSLSNGSLPVDTLRHWFPCDPQADNLFLSRLLPGGQVDLRRATFHVTLPAAPEAHGTFSLDGIDGEARSMAWEIGQARRAELTTLSFRQQDGQWFFERGSGVVAGLPVSLSGTLVSRSDGPAEITLDLGVSGTAGQFAALKAEALPADLTLAGTLAIKGQLTGTLDQYHIDAQIDLAQLEVRYGEQIHLPPTPGGAITAHGQGTRTTLKIDQAVLSLAALTGRMTGTIDWTGSPAANLSAHLELPDLTGAYDCAPVLRKLQLHGGAALDVMAEGPLAAIQPHVTLDLVDIGIPTHGFVADLTQLNGRLLFEGKGIRSEKLTTRLGKSPVTLRARVADLGAPRLELEVQAPAVRADELIFRSDRSILRDLDGRLVFDRDGLSFAPVKVRLDGGTRATVSGSVKNFAAPEVDLDITGEYANVEEIIGLWTNESPAARAARHARQASAPAQPLPPIRIMAEAKNGDLYSMKFAEARALIVPTSGHLLIHPLDFKVGPGYCTTQILVDFTGPETVLRVSGHAEEVDAYEIYNELLDSKSIMRGTMRGDFYLQGELGESRFLPTSYGNFKVAVHDGVMRHSPVMSTIFSLLNVSQLFKLKLPDVDREGVPFTLLTAELAIDKGILRTEDLVINSEAMNMSYVGTFDMVKDRLDLLVVVKPLGTIDKVVSHLPIAGWILTGENRALITAQFEVTGPAENPKVDAIPVSAMSKGVLGIFQRTLGLPLKLVEDPEILWGGSGEKK